MPNVASDKNIPNNIKTACYKYFKQKDCLGDTTLETDVNG
jgi:hypothetical protein